MNKFTDNLSRYLKKIMNKDNNRTADNKIVVNLRQFNVELELISGTHNNTNKHPSIIHFSFNKAATQYVKSILVECATEIGMVHAGINEYAFNSHFPYLDHLSSEEMKKFQHIFKKKGYLYSVFGGMIESIPELENYKIVLGVRDPRDMLVSGYYSQAFSHPAPDISGNKYEVFLEKRELARSRTIDQHVLDESIKMNSTFEKYHNLLLKQYAHVYVTKYEDMVADFNGWLEGLLCYCDLQISDALRVKIIDNNQKLKPTSEDISKHLRKGLPGDYKEKLQKETIQQLNETFSNYLALFGYVK